MSPPMAMQRWANTAQEVHPYFAFKLIFIILQQLRIQTSSYFNGNQDQILWNPRIHSGM